MSARGCHYGSTDEPGGSAVRKKLEAMDAPTRYVTLHTATFNEAEQLSVLELDDPEALSEFAENPCLNAATQLVLVGHGDAGVRKALARSSVLVESVQEALVRDPEWSVRWSLAWNTSVARGIQHSLAHDLDPEVRVALAGNGWTPEDVLEVLAGDPEPKVRRWTARNARLSAPLALALAQDDDVVVRDALMGNDSVSLTDEFPVATLELSDRGREWVSAARRAARVDAEAFAALRSSWSGTLDELVRTVAELAPSQP